MHSLQSRKTIEELPCRKGANTPAFFLPQLAPSLAGGVFFCVRASLLSCGLFRRDKLGEGPSGIAALSASGGFLYRLSMFQMTVAGVRVCDVWVVLSI